MAFLFADAGLARKLEAAEAASGLAMVEAMRARHGAEAAACEPVAGGMAVYCGPHSDLTRIYGAGVAERLTDGDLDRAEAFFEKHGAAPAMDVCPFVDPSLGERLMRRGYRPVEYSTALSCLIEPNDTRPLLEPCPDRELWARVLMQGVLEREDLTGEETSVGLLAYDMGTPYLGLVDGEPAGTGALAIRGDVAVFFGGSTRPAFRRRTVHLRLIWGRLRMALEAGITIGSATTAPGSPAQRNYERCGFRVAYTRTLYGKG